MVVLYRTAPVAGVGVGLLLAIAVATIDVILVARLLSGALVCPDPRCTRAVQIGRSQSVHMLIAFALGFIATYTWVLRRCSLSDG